MTSVLTEKIDINNLSSLWMDKVDYFEYQVSQFGIKFPIIRHSFNYFIGLADNAIMVINSISKIVIVGSISHFRVSVSVKLTDLLDSEELGIKELFIREVKEKDIPLEYPEMTLFMIIELVSSTVFTSIVEKQPLPIDEFKPHLYKTIRLLINEKEL